MPGDRHRSKEIAKLYPRPSRDEACQQSIQFVGTNHSSGQVYPGFDVETPHLDGEGDDES